MAVAKRYSNAAQGLITLALTDAERFRKNGDATEADAALQTLLSQRADGYLYAAADQLESSANYHGRISVTQFLGGAPYPVNLMDCWEERCLSAKFREQSSLADAKLAADAASLFAAVSVRWIPSGIHNLAFALWKLYITGREQYIKEAAPIFEVFDLRQDMTHMDLTDAELQAYDVSVCVTLLVAREKAEVEVVAKLLGSIPVFQGISEFWGHDSLFATFTERAAQWHIEYCLKNSGTVSRFADVAPDALLPAWILALDKFRQKYLQRPCSLGDHELLALSQEVFARAQAQTHPRLSALVSAEQSYREMFGEEAFNPLPFWEKYLSADA